MSGRSGFDPTERYEAPMTDITADSHEARAALAERLAHLIERSWNDEMSDLEHGHLQSQRAKFGVAVRSELPAVLDWLRSGRSLAPSGEPEGTPECPDFPPGTSLRHHVDGTHSIVAAEAPSGETEGTRGNAACPTCRAPLRVTGFDGTAITAERAEGTRDAAPGLDYEQMRKDRGWPTPDHMRRAADALDTFTPARYGDVLRWFADLADAALATPPATKVPEPVVEGWGPIHNPIRSATPPSEAPSGETGLDPERLARAMTEHITGHKTRSRTHATVVCCKAIAAEYARLAPTPGQGDSDA